MKRFNNFGEMFNAQSGIKKDAHVFNEFAISDRTGSCIFWDDKGTEKAPFVPITITEIPRKIWGGQHSSKMLSIMMAPQWFDEVADSVEAFLKGNSLTYAYSDSHPYEIILDCSRAFENGAYNFKGITSFILNNLEGKLKEIVYGEV